MPRRQLVLIAACLLVAPFLLGSYYPSCTNTTIGFYPNYPWRLANDTTAANRAITSHVTGTVLFVNWGDEFYNCPIGGCTVSSCSGGACAINTSALSAYMTPFLEQWTNKTKSSPLNVEIVFTLHTAGFGSTLVGPGHIRPLGVNSPTTRGAFKSFYDAVYNIVRSPNYNDGTGAYWLFSIGNEVNLYLRWSAGAWSDYTNFYNEMKAYVKDTAAHPGLSPLFTRVGVSTTYFGNLSAPGLWSLAGTPPVNQIDGFGWPRIHDLNLSSDAIIFTYYPVDAEHNYRALDPGRVATDFFWMDYLGAGLTKQVVLQEFGYPTDNLLHGSTDPLYSTYANGQQAQSRFVTNVMNAIRTPQYDPDYTIVAASWWSLFDYGNDPSATSGQCYDLAHGIFGSNDVWFRRWICTMGLVQSNNNNKLAWTPFQNGAIDAPNW